ncbi:MAG: amino acid adenylation domain-containing protein [Candidatus Aminicenantes bacterium]
MVDKIRVEKGTQFMNKFKKIDSKDIEDMIALTPMQEGMLFHYLREPHSDLYFQQLSLETTGEIDVEYFEKSWNLVIETNEMLRTVFRWEKLEHPIQIILKKHHIQPRYVDFSKRGSAPPTHSRSARCRSFETSSQKFAEKTKFRNVLVKRETREKKKHIEKIRMKDRKEKFDLREIPFRVTLCRIDNGKYEMIISNHHILYDGWSNGIILKEFFNAYNDLSAGKELHKPIKTRFKKFIKWNQDRDLGEQKKFWRDYLKGFNTPTPLEIKRRKGKETSFTESLRVNFSTYLTNKIEDFVKRRKTTLAAFLYSAWGILLQKYCNSGDVIFGVTTSGRTASIKGIEDMVGLFINTLPLRVKTGNGQRIRELLGTINDILPLIERNGSASLVEINGYSELKHNQELFDSIMVLENYPLDHGLTRGNHPLSPVVHSYSIVETTNYDLTIAILIGDRIEVSYKYNKLSFDRASIQILSHHFIHVIEKILTDVTRKVSDLEILLEEEKRKILFDFNNTAAQYPKDKTIHHIFAEQTQKSPDHIALIFKYVELTYQELNKRADQLAHLLQWKKMQVNSIVGLMVERSIEMIVGMLAILKAGGGYLPIDADYPGDRLKFMMADSAAKILVTDQVLSNEINFEDQEEIISVSDMTNRVPLSRHYQPAPALATSLAYVIYTSGSTGIPKGVLVEHGSVVNLVYSQKDQFDINEKDRVLQFSTICFDASVEQIFIALFSGAVLVLIDKGTLLDAGKFEAFIASRAITHLHAVPSFLDNMQLENRYNLKRILSGGDVCPVSLAQKWNKYCDFYNKYGPTETTVTSIEMLVADVDTRLSCLPVGRPINNTHVYLVDQWLKPVPLGVAGELYIGGDGVARGYLNRPELTAEKFDQDLWDYLDYQDRYHRSYRSYKSYILYKTGDLGRWLPDRTIEFLGRLDHQVKIRGFRIELGEVENQLINYDHIKAAVVTSNEDKKGDKYLCAYIVPHSPAHIEISHVQKHLMQKLPDYMIPTYFVQLEQIPLTPTGKIDRKALPTPEIKSEIQYTAPGNQIEKQLVELWSGVLGIQPEKIGVDYNFFQLGGHSLKAARLLARIHKKMDVNIPLARMFETPTVRGLTHCILEIRKTPLSAVETVEKREYYELSPSQKRFFVFWQWRPGDISYNMSEIMILKGLFSREKFSWVFQQLINRHESLRTSFQLVDGESVQRIHDDVEFEIEYYQVEAEVKVEREEAPSGQILNAFGDHYPKSQEPRAKSFIYSFIRPFDLARAPLVRLGFAKIQEEEHFLMFDMHHIVSDGVSMGIFIKEFLALYAGEQLPSLRVQYKEFVEWEKKERKKKKRKEMRPQARYQQTALNLPLDFPRPAVPDFQGNTIKFAIDGLEGAANFLSLQEEFTLFMVLLAAFYVFLSKISGQENIVVGSPIAGRQHPDLEGMIGLFINPLALQNSPETNKRFSDFLTEVKKNALQAFAYQDEQYDDMVEKVISSRDTSHNPLYDVMFVLQNMEIPEIEIPGLKVTRQVDINSTAKFDMTLYYEEFSSSFNLEYATALFKPETMQRFILYFKSVVKQILGNPHQTIAEIDMIPREERQRILYDFNDTAVEFPDDQCIYQLIAHQVQRTPDNLAAVQFHPHESSALPFTLTYRELNAQSNQLARLLRKRGIKTNTVVGIMMRRSPGMLMGILGILKAGGTYLPVDSQYPENRIANMLENSHASFLLTNRTIVDEKSLHFPTQQWEVGILLMDELREEWEKEPGKNLNPLSTPNDLIYIIFTSGSTGIPKGAGVYHRGIVNLMHWLVTEFDLNHHDRNLMLTSLSFDLTQKNLYVPLISGGQLCIPGFSYFEPRSLVRLIQEYRVTWITCTPSMFYQLVEYKRINEDKRLSSLRYVFHGGEPLSILPIIDWLESEDCRAEIVNTYGPTECTDVANFYRIKQPRRFLEEAVPIGQPINNVQLYVPDKNLKLLPVGIVGELYIGGAGVGIGYINDEHLTSQKFIKHSFDPLQPEQLLYRTGDLVKWLPDGNIQFLGRIDHQVKVRGFRIELGEIENQLLLHPKLKETVVMAREDEAGEKYLCAYIVPDSSEAAALNPAELREYLSRELPDYMVPAFFVVLEKMPLNPNGKVDRKALPEPGLTAKDNYVPPQNDTQTRLVKIWAEVLGLDKKQVGIHDNFFLSGGHSLKATTLISKIHKAFGVEMPIAEIFKQPTIKNISRYIEQSKESLYLPITPVEKREYYPLSSAQKRLFVIEQMEPGNVTYNIPAVLKLEGKLDRSCFVGSFKKLIARHESLRTSFQFIAGEPVQKIHEEVDFKMEYDQSLVNGQGRGEVVSPIKVEEIIRNFIRPFDLSHAPLIRIGLIELPSPPTVPGGHPRQGIDTSQEGNKDSYLLMVDMHHIISDGTSMEILVKEFTDLYCGKTLLPLWIRYRDYSLWQLREKEREEIKQQEDFWTREFAREIPVLELPLDGVRPGVQSYAGRQVTFLLNSQETGALNQWAVEHNSTLFMVLLAVFNVLLSKISGQEDMVMGTPVAGRRQADLQRIIGMFVNTLALRNYPAREKRFVEFLQEVRKKTLTALENQEYPFEDLLEQVVVNRDVSRNPLFDVMLVMGNLGLSAIPPVPGLKLSHYPYETGISKFDLTFYCEEGKEGVVVSVEYCLKLFTEKTVKKLISYFKKVIADIYNDKTGNIKIRDIEIISEEERKQILYDYNDTETVYPGDKGIHEFFADQAERTPDHMALIGQSPNSNSQIPNKLDEAVSITYKELNEKSNRWCHLLHEKGVKPDNLVGIMMERSVAVIIGILGILKAGGAYLPIDPDYPRERIDYLLKDSHAKILLKSHSHDQYHPTNCRVLNFEHLNFEFAANSGFPASDFNSSHLVYALYTSGSTGRPRGVLVEHGSAVNILSVLFKKYPLLKEDAYLLKTTYTFDVSVSELFGWFFGGGRLVILEPGGEKNPSVILDWIERMGITHINFVPSMFGVFLEMLNPRNIKQLSRLKYIFLAGETLLPHLVKKFSQFNTGIKLENIYGPTESTIYASQYPLRSWNGTGSIPIGKPLPNIRLYILNPTHQLQPPGLVGELCIGGKGLARGYLNRPALTAEKFNQDLWDYLDYQDRYHRSYRSYKSYILYKTGDLARWLTDGNIQFLGRLDFQVKVRGFRIELGEIENQLLKHGQIKEAVVMLKEDESGDKYLCAYIAAAYPGSKKSFNRSHLRNYLLNHLPGYMVPAYFMQVDELPLTPSGKIDRQVLLRTGLEIPGKYSAPRDELEENLVTIWSQVLNIAPGNPPSIGIDHNFFALGGHSLKAMTMVSQIQTRFHVTVPLAQVFKSATIRKLAAYIKTASQEKFIGIDPVEKKDYYRLSSAQKRLYILQQMDEAGIVYNLPSVVKLEGHVDNGVLADAFQQLIKRHESLRTSIEMIGEEPVQRVHGTVKFEIEYYKVEAEVKAEKEGAPSGQVFNAFGDYYPESQELRAKSFIYSFIRPFDLSQPPLLRVGLIHTRKQGRILVMDMHHIVSDGISMGIAANELMALVAGERPAPLRLQYKDYSQWQTSEQQLSSRKKQEEYWLKEFAGEVPVLELPLDYPRPALQSFAGKTSTFTIPAEKITILKEMAATESATLYMLLLAVFNILLAKLSSREDIVVGTVLAGRKQPELNSIMGMFVNTLALRNFPMADQSFANFLKDVKKRTLEAFENQEYGFEELVEKLQVKRDASRNPQFDVVFAMVDQNIETIAREGTDLKLKPHPYKSRISKFDLSLFGIETGENQLSFSVEYSTKLFKPETIERFTRYFKRIIAWLVKNPAMAIAHMDIVSEEEKQRILAEFNDTEAWYPKDKTIHRLLEAQVERVPHHIALIGQIPDSGFQIPNKGESCGQSLAAFTMSVSITYKELNEKSHCCAHWLMKKGVQPDTIVGIMAERSVEIIVGILGILKAGGAYLPIDPDYPEERITYMLKDSNARILLTSHEIALLSSPEAFNNSPKGTASFGIWDLGFGIPPPQGGQLAYIIYTSGTTARPKGTLIPHGNVVRLMGNNRFPFDFNDRDVWTLFHSCCFDFSVWEMYGALLYGGRLVVIPKMAAKDPGAFLEILEKEMVTVLNQVPSAFYNLASEELNHPAGKLKLKYIIFGGEALKPLKLKEFKQKYPGTTFINMFGITETTVHVTFKKIGDEEVELNSNNIGKPIPTLRTYVMDRHLQLQAPGVPGELLVGGEGVARGYLNQVELTGEKFVHNPYKPGERLYKSGDLVKLTDEGEMEYLGRIDQQVQVRGFRIELGEIESQLLNFTPVKEAVVIDRLDSTGDIQLAAYIVPDPRYAYPIQQLLKLESSGLTSQQQRCTWPNGMVVFYINRNETDFMYREIFEEQSYMKHGIGLQDGACIFDVGANIGVFSLFVHQVCKDAVIYSFEPIPRVFQLLTLNTSLYGVNVKLFPCGLSSEAGEAVFTYYPHNTVLSGRFADKQQEMKTVGAFLRNQPGQPLPHTDKQESTLSPHQVRELLLDRLTAYQLKCPMKPLSQIIKENGIQCIDLLKIDAEKSEQAVLAGIREQDWPKIRQLAIEVHNIDGRLDTIIRLLETHGYRVVVEQDPILKNTDLYNVYAVTPGQPPAGNRPKPYPQYRWADPEQLKNQARDFLKKQLPEYMIPSLLGLLQTLPLTSNNKVDRKALPDIISSVTAGPYQAPTDEIENKLLGIWSGILGIENHRISIDSDFFQLGGHSLKATIMISRIHKTFHVKIPLAEVFKTSTIKELAAYIRKKAKSPFTFIAPTEKKDYYALSSAQKRLYVLQQMEAESPVYTIPVALIWEGRVDKNKLETAFRGLIEKHESLRTSFDIVEGEPVQKINKNVEFEIEYDDLTIVRVEAQVEKEEALPGQVLNAFCDHYSKSQELRAKSFIYSFIRPFDLSQAPLVRVGLIRIHQSKHMLVINMHHTISDGISLAIMTREFTELYAGEKIPGLKLQFKDYSEWQNRNRERELLSKQQEYWLGQFEGEIPILKLPIDYPRPALQRFEGSTLKFVISPQQAKGLTNLAAAARTTIFMVLLAIYNIWLSKISGQEDIVVGIPTAGRRHADLESIIGMFVNTLAVRSFPHHDKTCEQLLLELKQQTLSAFENQDYPFEELVEQLPIHRDASRNPLFDTMFTLANMEMQSIAIPNVVVKPYQIESTTSKFDMSLNGVESSEGFVFTIEYCTKLFKKATVNRFISAFKQVLAAVLENPQKKIAHIEIITEKEKREILETFNPPPGEYPQKTFMELFKEQVKQGPTHIASYDHGNYLTFAALADGINGLTKVIKEL